VFYQKGISLYENLLLFYRTKRRQEFLAILPFSKEVFRGAQKKATLSSRHFF
jgi:hypothetical protein